MRTNKLNVSLFKHKWVWAETRSRTSLEPWTKLNLQLVTVFEKKKNKNMWFLWIRKSSSLLKQRSEQHREDGGQGLFTSIIFYSAVFTLKWYSCTVGHRIGFSNQILKADHPRRRWQVIRSDLRVQTSQTRPHGLVWWCRRASKQLCCQVTEQTSVVTADGLCCVCKCLKNHFEIRFGQSVWTETSVESHFKPLLNVPRIQFAAQSFLN